MLKPGFAFLLTLFAAAIPSENARSQSVEPKSIPIEPGEKWFGGAVTASSSMPFSEGYSLDLHRNSGGNQAAPLLLSTNGRFIWSGNPFAFSVKNGQLLIS